MGEREAGKTPPHEYFIDLAKRTPKVPTNRLTPLERKYGNYKFGNNFFLLFIARKRAEADPNIGVSVAQRHLVDVENRHGDQWRSFVQEHEDLIQQIDPCLRWDHYIFGAGTSCPRTS